MRAHHRLLKIAQYLYERLFEQCLIDRRRKRRLVDFRIEDRADLQIAEIDCRMTANCKSSLCLRASLNYDAFFRTHHLKSSNLSQQGRRFVTLMALDLAKYGDYQQYLSALRKKSYFPRKLNRALKRGYVFERFQYQNFTPDMRAIRKSDRTRAFGLPVDQFVLTPDALSRDPLEAKPTDNPSCERHWEMWFGVFRRSAGYRQGNVTTDQRLVAYARLRRIGNTIKYAEFIGHANYLSDGVMILLHMRVIEWIMNRVNQDTVGVRFVTYNTLERGSDGIFFWKRKALFEPVVTHLKEVVLPQDFNAESYLKLNPDVAEGSISPELHYLRHGHLEGRRYREVVPSTLTGAIAPSSQE